MAYPGKGSATGDVLTWDGSKLVMSPAASGLSEEVQAFPIASVESGVRVIWGGVPADGTLAALAVFAPQTMQVNKLSCYIVSPSPSGTVAMSLYSATGVRLAQSWDGVSSAFVPPMSGFNTLNVQTPVVIPGEALYYIAITSRANGAAFATLENRLSTGSPLLGIQEQNGLAGSSTRATIDPNSGAVTYRCWSAMLT